VVPFETLKIFRGRRDEVAHARPFFYLRGAFSDRRLRRVVNSKEAAAADPVVGGDGQALPSAIQPIEFGSTGKLFDEIRNFLTLHPGLTTDSIQKLTYFAFAIQFPECCGIWPFASVVAPDTAGSSLFLRMLSCLCINPVQIGEITLSAILTLPRSPRPTLLLIDQLATSSELERVLRAMSRPGTLILRNGQLHDVLIPTLVCTAEPLRDRWILDQAVQVTLTPTRGPLPDLDPQTLSESARNLKGKLLRYRGMNLAKVRVSHLDAPELSSPMREIANMLGSCIVDDASLRRLVPMLLRSQDQDVRARRTDSVHAVEIEAALFLSHENKRGQARIGEITTIANGILRGRGESIQLDPREVGNHLRALGLFSERLGRAGRGIRFMNEIRQKIHQLSRAYDVRSSQGDARCEFCAEGKITK
jgi:hypothetical protein